MLTLPHLTTTLTQIFTPELLAKARVKDPDGPNGLQIRGSEKINKIITGVSISAELINHAIKEKAQAIIVHHGMWLNFPHSVMNQSQQLRLKLLLTNNINLFGFHYALDAHPTIGNNAILAKKLNAKIISDYFDTWGFVAELPKAVTTQTLANKLKKILDHDVFVINNKNKKIKKLGIVSGGGIPRGRELLEVIEKNVDAHITGEVKESVPHRFLELGISYLAGGHYATETVGIKALTEKLNKKNINTKFIDLYNPL